MTSGISVVTAWAGAASASNSFTITDAVVIFVVAVVLLTAGVAIAGRRTRLLVSRPRLRTSHSRRVRRAAIEDVRGDRAGCPAARPRPPAAGRFPAAEEEDDDL